jgi:hypothetical protein
MQPSDNMHSNPSQNPTWHLFAEFSLHNEIGNDEQEINQISVQLIDAVRELELPSLHLSRIEETLLDATRNAKKRSVQEGSALPISIRLFIQKKMQVNAHEGLASAPNIAAPSHGEHAEIARKPTDANKHAHKGWGYFLTERRVDHPGSSSEKSFYLIELFLYTEKKQGRPLT